MNEARLKNEQKPSLFGGLSPVLSGQLLAGIGGRMNRIACLLGWNLRVACIMAFAAPEERCVDVHPPVVNYASNLGGGIVGISPGEHV